MEKEMVITSFKLMVGYLDLDSYPYEINDEFFEYHMSLRPFFSKMPENFKKELIHCVDLSYDLVMREKGKVDIQELGAKALKLILESDGDNLISLLKLKMINEN